LRTVADKKTLIGAVVDYRAKAVRELATAPELGSFDPGILHLGALANDARGA
jgi:hypothetical protein